MGVAGNRAQIGPNGLKLMVCHVPVQGPGHDLQQTAVDGREIAIVGNIASAIWMQLVEVMACPQNLHEGAQIVAAFGVASVIGCQVAGNDVRAKSRGSE